jgi:predicted RNase H-like HicB family nuclease
VSTVDTTNLGQDGRRTKLLREARHLPIAERIELVAAIWDGVAEQSEDGVFVAEVPSLPGCVTQGSTRSEALANAREAIAGYLDSLAKWPSATTSSWWC